MTLDLARSCSTYVTTIINGADLIPTVSAGQPTLLAQAIYRSCVYLWVSDSCGYSLATVPTRFKRCSIARLRNILGLA